MHWRDRFPGMCWYRCQLEFAKVDVQAPTFYLPVRNRDDLIQLATNTPLVTERPIMTTCWNICEQTQHRQIRFESRSLLLTFRFSWNSSHRLIASPLWCRMIFQGEMIGNSGGSCLNTRHRLRALHVHVFE